MNEPLLRGKGGGCLGGSQGQRVYDLTVNNLMLANVKQWDIQKIRNLFVHKVVYDILKAPLVEEVLQQIIYF